jgi:hypothetical protein
MLTPPPPDSDYPYRGVNFDGLFEQPHDNYHGWIGPDMADNAYTAFDLIFWSYHANVDRLFETWMAAHKEAVFSSQFPLRPFVGQGQKIQIDMAEPREWVSTLISDITRNCKALGYTFDVPKYPDYQHAASTLAPCSSHIVSCMPVGVAMGAARKEKVPYIVFDGIKCTMDSFSIDVFLVKSSTSVSVSGVVGDEMSLTLRNPHYVGCIVHLGMGTHKNSNRCIKGRGITRVLKGKTCAQSLGLKEGMEINLIQVMRRLVDGSSVEESEWKKWNGFVGELVWGQPLGGM